MVAISLLNPLDQPTGRKRLLAHLREGLRTEAFSSLRLVVAYAKAGPLLRLQSVIEEQRARGLAVEAIFGVDQQGTSAQALTYALEKFDGVWITTEAGLTFHPKFYVFQGEGSARVFVGSNNLTVGGTETNFESAVQIDFELPKDEGILRPFNEAWQELLPEQCPATVRLTPEVLGDLMQRGVVLDENAMRQRSASALPRVEVPRTPRSGLRIVPPSALPRRKVPRARPEAQQAPGNPAIPHLPAPSADLYTAKGLAIQIKPHHNGEVFLSVTAALQNPPFFKWPFNGQTVPKKGTNTAYPQLTPDPIADITVYGAAPEHILALRARPINTVYYERKSEIRITISPLRGIVPDYSVMIIQLSETEGVDYDIIIHTPDSPDYAAWIAACNQSMPGGGQVPRKFGWF